MLFDGKPAHLITADEVRRLVTDKTGEGRHVDFKKASYAPHAHGAAEVIKDVTAFLNTDGGYIIIGVADDGRSHAAGFTSVDNPDGVRRSIMDHCLTKISPRPSNLEIAILDVDGHAVVIVHVPESDSKPHCAIPNAEHHYFWRRYEDGNKLMSPAEMRECMEGDNVHREILELRRELVAMRHERSVAQELSTPVDEAGLLQLRTPEALLKHIEAKLKDAIGNRPYYRVFACPDHPEQVNLQDKVPAARALLNRPPAVRPHGGGWDLTPYEDVRVTQTGLMGGQGDGTFLRLLWNGYLEFRIPADDEIFHWGEIRNANPITNMLYPYAVIEPAACFALLARDVCHLAAYTGTVKFGLSLYNIKGMYLLPYGPTSFGYMMARSRLNASYGPKPFPENHIKTPLATARADDLPGSVAWNLVSQVYYAFGYEDKEIPFFSDAHEVVLK